MTPTPPDSDDTAESDDPAESDETNGERLGDLQNIGSWADGSADPSALAEVVVVIDSLNNLPISAPLEEGGQLTIALEPTEYTVFSGPINNGLCIEAPAVEVSVMESELSTVTLVFAEIDDC